MNAIKTIFLVSLLITLTGCTSMTYRQPLSVVKQSNLTSEEMLVNYNQKQLISEPKLPPPQPDLQTMQTPQAAANPLAAGVGTVIGDYIGNLIVNSINTHQMNTAQQAMAPITDELTDFDVMVYFKQQLTNNLSQSRWMKIKNSQLKYHLFPTDARKISNTMTEDALLFATTQYRLNNNFTALRMNANIKLFTKNSSDLYGQSPDYQNNFTYIYYLPAKDTNRQQAIDAWTQNHGQLIKATLRQAATMLSQLIKEDIENVNPNLYQNDKSARIINFNNEYHQRLSGKLVRMQNGLYIVRSSNDMLYIVNTDALNN